LDENFEAAEGSQPGSAVPQNFYLTRILLNPAMPGFCILGCDLLLMFSSFPPQRAQSVRRGPMHRVARTS
jgi:hypothetical protein